jgi:hypothetical protein
MRRQALVPVAVIAGLLVAVGVAGASSSRATFANGTWKGTARLSTTLQGLKLVANSSLTLRIRAGRASGTMVSTGLLSGVSGGSKVSVTMNGRYRFTGTAARPVAKGKLTFHAVVDGKPQSAGGAVLNTFGTLRGTCDRMTGKVTLTAAKADPSAQVQSMAAPFVAKRVPGSGPRC